MKRSILDQILFSTIYGMDLELLKRIPRGHRESQEKTYECVVVKGREFFREDTGSNV